ncbi:MAG: potassium channel protein [Nitrospirae bacterium]|nr:potassium channel protein [Nitrospirota bacterium]MCL5976788.1 potassium channel protein [Nitrospirota bacterium]
MADNLISEIYKKFFWVGIALLDILLIGTVGYWFVGEGKYSMLDCLYMTVITIATIGYGEIVDMSNKPAGRIFTMILSFSGIGILTYILSSLTAFVVEGELNETFRRRKMEKMIKKFREHYIICGIEGVGFHIVKELHETQRPHVIVDIDRKKIEKILETFKERVYIEGDATDSDTLLKAGIMEAKGLFAVSGDDNQNLVISLTAKQINPNVRVVARCHDLKNIEKMKKAGADAVVSPTFIGGLRMASEMVRPAVVSFLDTMLRDKQKNLRIEEVLIPDSFAGKSIADLNLKKYHGVLLMAVKTKDDWAYNPPDDYMLKPEDALIFMTTPEERFILEKIFCS